MEPLSTMLLAAISAAATAIGNGIAEAVGDDTFQAARRKFLTWRKVDSTTKQQAALQQAIQAALTHFANNYRGDLSAQQMLTVLADPSPAAQALRQALAEELLFRASPDIGAIADHYRRDLGFVQWLRGEQIIPWASMEPVLLTLADLINGELERSKALRPLILERAELQALDAARATAQASRASSATLERIEALLGDLATLPRISVSISAADSSTISNTPVTIMLGNQPYAIPPLTAEDVQRLYTSYQRFIVQNFGTLDFRGILQVQNLVQLPLKDIYVPLRAQRPPRTNESRLLVEGIVDNGQPFPFSQPEGAERRILAIHIGSEKAVGTRSFFQDVQSSPEIHQLVRDEPFLAVLGDPGAGKSTLVRMIMLALVEGRATAAFGLRDEWLPIFFPVAAFAEARSTHGNRDIAPMSYLRTHYQGREQPDYTPLFERALLSGRAMVLFDGLDEVREDRLEIIQCLEDFIHHWDAPGNRFLATSRIAGYEDAPLDDSLFTRTTVQPFNNDDIRLFAAHWSMAYERAGAPTLDPADPALRQRTETRTHALTAAIFAEQNVTELARNPLLLTILALIHNQGTRLPDRRVDLYRLCVQALAETWNRARALSGKEIDVYLGDNKLDERFVVNLLGPAALWIHSENPGGIVEARDLERELTRIFRDLYELSRGEAADLAADFLRIVNRETGLLQERGHQRYSFLHLTFEEYLAARALIESVLVDDPNKEIHQRATDPGWREVLRLALASASQREAQRLLLHLLDAPGDSTTKGRPVVLAGECMRDIGNTGIARRIWDTVISALLRTIADSTVPVTIRVEAGTVIGTLGDLRLLNPETGKAIGEGDYDAVEPYWCEIEAGPFWSGDDRNEKLQHANIRQPYAIARFPLTNAEYAQFIAAGGYDMRQPWWTDNGRARISERRQPYFWDDSRYNQSAQPVVGVEWYEAAAYCSWLTRIGHEYGWLPIEQVIRLPTWYEWERAARHTDQRRHPWGNEAPTPERANYEETGLNAPSPVGCFPAGAAVCGAQDLQGNVFEWTASPWQQWDGWEKDFTNVEGVVLSWNDFTDEKEHLCCGARDWDYPDHRLNDQGFRVLQSLAL